MKTKSSPLYYWVLGFTLAFPVISWLLITRDVVEFSILEYSIDALWYKYYKGLETYRTAVLIYCTLGALLACLVVACRDRVENNWQRVLSLMILAGLIAAAVFAFKNKFTIDEWEHIHSAWNIHRGKQPLIDFFQHHHGLMWHLLSPVIPLFENHSSILLFARFISLVFWMVTLIAVYRTSQLLTGDKTSSKFAVLLLLTYFMCTSTALQFRPDNPQVAFGALSFYFFVCFRKNGRLPDIVVSGICMGISFLFLQKAVFFLFPFGTYQLYLAFTRRTSWTSVAVFTGSFFIPVLPFAAMYIASGHVGEYLLFNWVLNIMKTSMPGGWGYMIPYTLLNPFFPVFFVTSLFFLLRQRKTIPIDLIATALMAVVLTLLAFMQPKVWRQYFQPVWPVATIFAGFFLNRCFGHHRKYLQALVVLYIAGISFGILWLTAFTESNRDNLYLVDYLQQNNITENYAVDPYLSHNAFARDMHFFWFSLRENTNYPTYQKLINQEPYSSWVTEHHDDYDFCGLVATKRPKYIFTYKAVVEDLFRCDAEIVDRYESGPWEGLYRIKDAHAIPVE